MGRVLLTDIVGDKSCNDRKADGTGLAGVTKPLGNALRSIEDTRLFDQENVLPYIRD